MLYPMMTLVCLTFALAIIVLAERLYYFTRGDVSHACFDLTSPESGPVSLQHSDACYKSMFNMPILFFPVCTLHIVMDVVSVLSILVAWTFVICRVLHAALVLSGADTLFRAMSGILSSMCIFALWLNVLLYLPIGVV